MPESPPPPSAERRPAWRAAAVAYRQARRDGASHDAAMAAAERSLLAQWPELPAKEALPKLWPRSATRALTTLRGSGTASVAPLISPRAGRLHKHLATYIARWRRHASGLPGCSVSGVRRRATFGSKCQDAAFLNSGGPRRGESPGPLSVSVPYESC
jgi:hypothetical protein